MARTPFYARIFSPTSGNLTYTVPAGKFAICNAFWVPNNNLEDPTQTSASSPKLRLNGTDMVNLDFSSTGFRWGPFVFNAGDVISCPYASSIRSGQPPQTPSSRFGLCGFLYDQSARKAPVNQKLIVGTTSYTVPANKHVVINFFTLGFSILKINGNQVAYWGYSPQTGGSLQVGPFGPITASAGQVFSFDPHFGMTPGQEVFMSGFIYND